MLFPAPDDDTSAGRITSGYVIVRLNLRPADLHHVPPRRRVKVIVADSVCLKRIRRRHRQRRVSVNRRQRRARSSCRRRRAYRHRRARNRMPRRPEYDVVFARPLRASGTVQQASAATESTRANIALFIMFIAPYSFSRRSVVFIPSTASRIYLQLAASILILLPAHGERKA